MIRRRTPPTICHDVAAWAQDWPGARRVVLDRAFTTRRPLPTSPDPVDETFARLREFEVAERALVTIPCAGLRGDMGLVVLPNGEFVGELVALTPAGRRQMLSPLAEYRKPLPRGMPTKRGGYFALLGLGREHYYHWTHDLIMGARGIGERLPADTKLIVPPTLRPFQNETLSLLNLDHLERVPFPPGACWRLEELHVVTPRLKTQIDSPEPYGWLRAAVQARYGVVPGPATRRLYVSRQRDNHWRAVNHAELHAALGKLGFETVEPGTLTVRAQVELFSTAAIIVGTGAGLFNMAFAPSNAKVLQFQDPTHMVHALWTEAGALGIEYHYILCEPVDNNDHEIADFRVPIDKLRRALATMGVG